MTQGTQRGQSEFEPAQMRSGLPAGFPPDLNDLSSRIIGAAMDVHTALGPGLRECLYEVALVKELSDRGLRVDRQVRFDAAYKGTSLPTQIMDMVVDGRVLLELKSVSKLTDEDHAQLLGYLFFTQLPLGLLLNFGHARLRDGIHRKINYPPKCSPDVSIRCSLFEPSVSASATSVDLSSC